MEPIVDETSLVVCSVHAPSRRIIELARTLRALDEIGAPRVLRSVRDAADREIGDGLGLRHWCFDAGTDRDAGRLVALRLASQPYIDGDSGLFATAEGTRAVEARIGALVVAGVGLAMLTDGLVVVLSSQARPEGNNLKVDLSVMDSSGDRLERLEIRSYALAKEVIDDRAALVRRIDAAFRTGADVVRRLGEVFPCLVLGDQAREQIESLTGAEPVFRQLVRHLRALDDGARSWEDGGPYEPRGVSWSVESKATLDDGSFGPMRDFPTPDGFESTRWSLHTKLTGGNGARIYFRPVRTNGEGVVLLGYFGDHLPTTKYPT